MAAIWQRAHGYHRGGTKWITEDRPQLLVLSDGAIRLELTGPDGVWIVELTIGECEQIAEAIGREAPGSRPATCDD